MAFPQPDLQEMGEQVKQLATLAGGGPRFCFKAEQPDDGQPEKDGVLERPMQQKDIIGGGAYGMVAKCFDKKWGKFVAVKRVDWGTIEREVRRIIREVQVLRHLRHPNLIHLVGLFRTKAQDPDGGEVQTLGSTVEPYNIYIVSELMDVPLSQLIHQHSEAWYASGAQRGQYAIEHVIWLIHQMLHGLHAMHTASIVHRDIKPHNLLVNLSDTTLRICDFGLSRASQPSNNVSHYVVTRYYRAPEIVFGISTLDPAIDVWAAGCVAAELLLGEPLFAINSTTVNGKYNGGKASQALLRLLNRLGKPCDEDIADVPHVNVQAYLSKITGSHLDKGTTERDVVEFIRSNKRISPLQDTPPDSEQDLKLTQTLKLIDTMLQFNPKKRPTSSALLAFEVFSKFSRPDLIKSCPVFDTPDPTETPGFTIAKGTALLMEEIDKPVIEEPWWDDDEDGDEEEEDEEDDGQSSVMEFLTLTANGGCPTPRLWQELLQGQFTVVAAALSELGISPEMSALEALSSDQLRKLSHIVTDSLRKEALGFLNKLHSDDTNPSSGEGLIPTELTLQNVTELRPIIYARLSNLSNPTSQTAEAIRINVDFLVNTLNLTRPPGVSTMPPTSDIDWCTTGAAGDDSDSDQQDDPMMMD